MATAAQPQSLHATSQSSERVSWVDYAKGLGIFLVVVGHVLRGVRSAGVVPDSPLALYVDSWIYAFHMPLFFFLSGVFLERAAARPPRRFFSDKLATIAWPYLVWSLVQGSMQAAMSGYTNQPVRFVDLWRVIYEPQMQYWFLYVLMLGQMLYFLIRRARLGALGFVAFATAFLATTGWLDLGSWGVLFMLRTHLIYIALGVLAGSRAWHVSVGRARATLLVPAALIGFLVLSRFAGTATGGEFLSAAGLALAGIIASIAAMVLASRARWTAFLEHWGHRSLEIYVAHTIATAGLRILLQGALGVTDPAVHVIGGTAIGLYAPLLFHALAARFGFGWLFNLKNR
jgi:fucose 4-O-acetylase-like acetyltransferase